MSWDLNAIRRYEGFLFGRTRLATECKQTCVVLRIVPSNTVASRTSCCFAYPMRCVELR